MTETQSSSDDTRQCILQTAAELFAEKGYARTTTRSIAESAGVNEVTIFRHFGSKKNLLAEIMQSYSAIPDFTSLIENRLTGEYRQDLTLFAEIFLNTLLKRQDALRLILCEAHELSEIRDIVAQIPKQLRRAVTQYLQQQIEQGVVQDGDPELMAQAFLGMFFSYAVAGEILGGSATLEQPVEDIIAQFVDIFVGGTLKV